MKQFKIVAIFVGILVLVMGAGLLYFAHMSQEQAEKEAELTKTLEGIEPGYKKLSKEKMEAESKYAELLKEYDALRKDRDNVLIQTKRLLQEKNDFEELKASMPELQEENLLLEGEKQRALEQSRELEEDIKDIEAAKAAVEEERNHFQREYESLQKSSAIKGLTQKISNLTKENKTITDVYRKKYDTLEKDFKQVDKKSGKLQESLDKAEAKIGVLEDKLAELKDNYAVAVKKNRALEREVRNIPRKFSEIGRQNQKLVKDTGEMHYNLGVFYTNHKEYKRAIAEFEGAVDINPDDASAHFNLGYLYAEYLVDRQKAIEHFRHFLRLAKGDDDDVDWVKKYLLVWEAYEGKTATK